MAAADEWMVVEAESFVQWRDLARRLLREERAPESLQWVDLRSAGAKQQSLLAGFERPPGESQTRASAGRASAERAAGVRVPKSFLELAKWVAQHRDAGRWELLYRMLWRITGGERSLLEVATDGDVYRAQQMQKAVRRDAHKMKAFVRFRATGAGTDERYVAWHRPDHYVVPLTAPFFAKRFDVMRWAILTPDESVMWDGERLEFGPGSPRSEAPRADEMETHWKTYYASIFNPARVKLGAMRAEMPRKHWATMPETELIDSLVRQAPRRMDEMIERQQAMLGAEPFLPSSSQTSSAPAPHEIESEQRDKTRGGEEQGASESVEKAPEGMSSEASLVPTQLTTLDGLRTAARDCRGCALCEAATQTVFGEGPARASLVLVGEQPGDQEDRAGRPFVGPAGQLLDELLQEAGIEREQVYVTNAVKHFKFRPLGGRRLHVKPSSREISACRPWLMAELELVRPALVVALGATAARTLLGPNFKLTQQRGSWTQIDVGIEATHSPRCLATYHPSAILRADDAKQTRELREAMREDLSRVARVWHDHEAGGHH